MTIPTRGLAGSVTFGVVAGVLLTIFSASSAQAQGTTAYVLSNNTLIPITVASPNAPQAAIAITGLTAGDTLVGIDFRPQNGHLYGLGHNSGAGTVQLYHISHRTGVATAVGATGTFVASNGSTPIPITGTAFGFDFNPLTDRVRVVTNSGQNFRMNPNTGAFIDGDQGGAPGSVLGLNLDGQIAGAALLVDGAAYTNNQPNATATTLYTLNASANALYIQNPPNAGTQTASALLLTTNGFLLDFTSANGFDIPPNVNVAVSNNPVATGSGFAALTVGGVTSLYSLNLVNGVATQIGTIGNGTTPVQSLAVQGAPVSGGLPAIGITSGPSLVRFNTATIGTSTTVAMSGLVALETIVGIDWRPQTGQLFGMGVNGTANTGTLYLIDPQTGALTTIGSPSAIELVQNDGTTPVDLPDPVTIGYGFDFNPSVDRIRVVTNTGLNFRVNPSTGFAVDGNPGAPGTNADTPINGLPGGSTGLMGAAYTNSYGQSIGTGGVTNLFVLDPISNRLFIQNSANGGVLIEGSIVTLDNATPLDFTSIGGFDFLVGTAVTSATATEKPAGIGLAALTVGGVSRLYTIEPRNGRATMIGVNPTALSSFTIGDGPLFPTTTVVSAGSPNPALIGQPVTFTATVSPAHATGTVAFTAGGVGLPGCGALQVGYSGVVECVTDFAMAGNYSVVATYAGGQNHSGSASSATTQTITTGSTATTTVVTANPNPGRVGENVLLTAFVTPSTATGVVTFRVDGTVVGTGGVSGGQATQAVSSLVAGQHQVTATYGGDATYAASTSPASALTILAAGTFTQYFAEGATGFFHTDIGIVNASETNAAHITVTLFPEGGAPQALPLTLDPLTRRTIDVNATLGDVAGVSALVESDQPVGTMRQMTWGSPVYGSTLESGIPSTSTTWYFAEGATNVFSLYYLIENPGGTAANVTLTHLLEGGGAPVVQNETVPAFSRRTFNVNSVPGLEGASLSTVITSSEPIVAERAMYLNTTARVWEGGHAGRGATSLSASWSFAEGATGSFFHTYLLLGNPNTTQADVTVNYLLPDGTTVTKLYPVAGQSRRTVDVNFDDPQLAATSVGMIITSTLPIVSERAMWWGTPFFEGSSVVGSTQTGTLWAIGEAAEGGPANESTFVLVSNAASTSGTVRMTVVYDDNTREQKDYTLLGSARLTVRVADDFAKAIGRKVSVLVESLTTSVPITVEVSRYQSPGGFGDGGGAALATRIH